MLKSVYAIADLIRYAWSSKEILLLRDFSGSGYFLRAFDATSTEQVTLGVDGSLAIGGSLAAGSRTVTSGIAITMTTSDFILLVNKTGGSPTEVDLPAAAKGKLLYVVDAKGDAAINNITIKTTGGALVNGGASYVLSTNGAWAMLLSDGTNWIAKTI